MLQKKNFKEDQYYGNYFAYLWHEKIFPVLLIAFVVVIITSIVYFIKWLIDPYSLNSF